MRISYLIIIILATIILGFKSKIIPSVKNILIEKTDTFLIQKGKVGPIAIGMPPIKLKRLYKNFEFREIDAFYYGLDGDGTGTLVSKNQIPYLFYVLDEDSLNIKFLICLNPKYHTSSGIRPGMTIKQLKSIFPDCEVRINMENDSEYIDFEDLDISCDLEYIQGERAGNYGNQEKDPEIDIPKTKIIRSDVKIYSIMVF